MRIVAQLAVAYVTIIPSVCLEAYLACLLHYIPVSHRE